MEVPRGIEIRDGLFVGDTDSGIEFQLRIRGPVVDIALVRLLDQPFIAVCGFFLVGSARATGTVIAYFNRPSIDRFPIIPDADVSTARITAVCRFADFSVLCRDNVIPTPLAFVDVPPPDVVCRPLRPTVLTTDPVQIVNPVLDGGLQFRIRLIQRGRGDRCENIFGEEDSSRAEIRPDEFPSLGDGGDACHTGPGATI